MNSVIRKGYTEKVAFEQRPEGGGGTRALVSGRTAVQTQETAGAKCAQHVWRNDIQGGQSRVRRRVVRDEARAVFREGAYHGRLRSHGEVPVGYVM